MPGRQGHGVFGALGTYHGGSVDAGDDPRPGCRHLQPVLGQLDPADGEVLTARLVRRATAEAASSTGEASGSKSTTDPSSAYVDVLAGQAARSTLSEFAITSNPVPCRYACTFPAGR